MEPIRPFYVYFLLKQELKYLSNNIRVWKQIRGKACREQRSYLYDVACQQVAYQAWKFRHLHIATSLSKGKSYEQIERTVRNAPDMDLIMGWKKWIDESLARGREGKEPTLESAGDIFRRDSAFSPEDIYRRNQDRHEELQRAYC